MCLFIKLYHFGETVSIVFWTDTWRPTSFCEKIVANRRRGLHTLCLLGMVIFPTSDLYYILNIFRYQN
jgi:diphthine synthase